MDFSQRFKPSQLEHYTPRTALLPHILQILHTTGLWRPDVAYAILRRESPTHFSAKIVSRTCGTSIVVNTNIDSAVRRRVVSIADSGGRRVVADFLGVFHNGVPIKYPVVVIDDAQ